MGIHWQELVIVLVIVLVLFGPRRLPEIGRSLGSGLREFKDSVAGGGKGHGNDHATRGDAATEVAGLPAPSSAAGLEEPLAANVVDAEVAADSDADAVPAGAGGRRDA